MDDLLNTEFPIDAAIPRINDNIHGDGNEEFPDRIYWDLYNIYTFISDSATWGRTPRMYRSLEWDDLEPGDIDDQGHEHPVRFLIVHKDNQGLTSYEKQNALRNLGIDKADTEHYGLVKYTDDWQYSGGGTEDFPLTLTRSAIVDLFMNTATEERESIAESALRAEDAAISAAASAAQAEDSAERTLLYYGGYSRIMPVEPYFYEVWYDTLDYKYAFDYFSTQDIEPNLGGCTAVRNGSVYGRNYDWTYDDKAEFIVHTSAKDGRHAVVGVATNVPGLTDDFVKSWLASEMYKLVPFRLVDGMNDAGLVINVNVVPVQDASDPYKNRHINYDPDHKVTLCLSMLPRFILDNFSTVDEAIDYITDNVNLYYSTQFLREHKYEYHYLVADKEGTTKCIEFKDGEISAFSVLNHQYITNFHVEDIQWNASGNVVNTPVDEQKPGTKNHIEDYGAGLERINKIALGYSTANTVAGMKALMQSVFYSRAYAGNNWEEILPAANASCNWIDEAGAWGLPPIELRSLEDPENPEGAYEVLWLDVGGFNSDEDFIAAFNSEQDAAEALIIEIEGVEYFHITAKGDYAGERGNRLVITANDIEYYTALFKGGRDGTPRWYTEFVGDYSEQGYDLDLTVNSNPQDFNAVISYADQQFANRNRQTGTVWQTTHSIVYDLENLKAYVYVQEADKDSTTLDLYHEYNVQPQQSTIVIDPEPQPASGNAVASGGVYDKLQEKQDNLASLNAGLNISIHDKGLDYQHAPEISAAAFSGLLDSSLHVGNGAGGQKASCLIGIGHPCAGGRLSVKNTAEPGSTYTLITQLGPDIENRRTIQDLVDALNDSSIFNTNAEASVYSDNFIKITHKVAGESGNSFVYKAETQYWSGEPQNIQFPCFGVGEVQQGSLVPGRDTLTNYDLTVNGTNVLLDTAPEHIALVDHTVMKHNRVYDLARNVTATGGEDWTVQQGATAEIYIDCTTTAYNVTWPNSWIWGDSGVFKASESASYKPALALGTVTCVVVRKHGNDVIAHVEYVIDKN